MKKSFILLSIGDLSAKGNVSLKISYKKGLIKQTLYILADEADTKELKVGQDITDMMPDNFVIRPSILIGDEGQEIVTKWIELV
jgi:hypothetical protein